MITWIVYIIVGFILFFVSYLAILGINRGVEAKNFNKTNNLKKNSKHQKKISDELEKLKDLYNDGTISKKEFIAAKKKLLS